MPLNVSVPKKRPQSPVEELRERHDVQKRSRNTVERQRFDPDRLARLAETTHVMDANPPHAIPKPLWAPGNGKAAGSKRCLDFPGPTDD